MVANFTFFTYIWNIIFFILFHVDFFEGVALCENLEREEICLFVTHAREIVSFSFPKIYPLELTLVSYAYLLPYSNHSKPHCFFMQVTFLSVF